MIDAKMFDSWVALSQLTVKDAIKHTLPGNILFIGQHFVSQTRALPGAEHVYRNGSAIQFKAYEKAMEEIYGDCAYWKHGVLYLRKSSV